MQTLRQATQEISMYHFNRVFQSSLLVSAIPLQKNQRRPHRSKLTRNLCDNRIITLQPRLRLSNICNIVPLMLILHKARHQIGVLTGSRFNMTITIFLLPHKAPHQSNTNRQIHTMQADKTAKLRGPHPRPSSLCHCQQDLDGRPAPRGARRGQSSANRSMTESVPQPSTPSPQSPSAQFPNSTALPVRNCSVPVKS